MFRGLISGLTQNLPVFLCRLPALLLALTVHETAHGYVANKLGDPTAKDMGRLTLNPLKHLDPIGALMMLFFGFGWARPVPINPRNFRHPKTGMALSALAGPVSNILLAFLGVLVYEVLYLTPIVYSDSGVVYALFMFLTIFIYLNVSLAIFNLIPVPPLDGSRILLTFLPPKAYFGLMKYERYIVLVLIILLYIDIPTPAGSFNLISTPISFLSTKLVNGMFSLLELLPFFR